MIFLPLLSAFTSARSGAEDDLISRAKSGNRRAFDELVRTYQQALRGFVAMRVGPDAAEDVLQETWTACWLGLTQYGGKSRFKAWLYGIAANKCADHLRGRVRRSAQSLDTLDEIPHADSGYAHIEAREAVKAALGRLPDAQREVVELYYYAGLSLPEIAENLRRNLNTVKYQFYRAHDQVADEIRASA